MDFSGQLSIAMETEDQVSLDLGQMQTQWSLVRKAHQASVVGESSSDARKSLVMRYAPAIRRFVQIVVSNQALADELSQDAIMRVLQGDFAGADPQRGRFRDLLKTAIRNMAKNNWAKESRRSASDFDLTLLDDDNGQVQQMEEKWTAQWRENILKIVWGRLSDWQKEQPSSVVFTVLKLRSEFPEASSTELAGHLAKAVGREFSPENTRQLLRRSRVKYVEFLVNEVAQGVEDPSPQTIKDELISLGLFANVKDLLPAQWRI